MYVTEFHCQAYSSTVEYINKQNITITITNIYYNSDIEKGRNYEGFFRLGEIWLVYVVYTLYC